MGAINYRRNCPKEGFINIGLNLGRFRSPLTIMRRVSMMQEIIDSYQGTWFEMSVEPGYYEGAWVSVGWDEDIVFYNKPQSWEDICAEITQFNSTLQLLVGVGCVEYFPDWCTKYSTAEKTRRAIIANVEHLYKYYKEVYWKDNEDD